MKVKYNKGGKSPVDPPQTSPDSKSKYNIGNMYFVGEEADRLIAFDEYLEKQFPNLDLFQRAEQVEKFLKADAHKSNEAMDSYSVDPSLAEVKAPSLMDSFGSEFGSSPFGDSDPFDDDPDIQRMREEAAAREKKKGKRNKRFENGGVTMKVKYGKGGSSDGMYAEAGALITGLAKNKEMRDAMKAEIAKYEEGGSVTGGDKGKKKPGGGSTDMGKDPMDPEVVGKTVSFGFGDQDEYETHGYMADGVSAEDFENAQLEIGKGIAQRLLGNQPGMDKIVNAAITGDKSGLDASQKKLLQVLYKKGFSSTLGNQLYDKGVLVSDYRNTRTRDRVSPEMKAAMEERGLTFTTDRPGLNAVYTVGKAK